MIEYSIAAIPTEYRGRRYRSRLEAKWAAMFHALEWPFEYEPLDFGPWSPDFALLGDRTIFVEVKPIANIDAMTAQKMNGVPGEHLLVGIAPFRSKLYDMSNPPMALGWFIDIDADDTEAIFVQIGSNRDDIDIVSAQGRFYGRMSGLISSDDEDSPDYRNLWLAHPERIGQAWSQAANAVQWGGYK